MAHKTFAERFWPKVQKTDGCWLWTAAKNEHGYGIIGRGARGEGNVKAHRASYEMEHGTLLDTDLVLHKCDVPACVNPAHLFVGTYADNVADMLSKDRECRGEACSWSKLTQEQVDDARARHKRGESALAIAKDYGVSRSLITAISRGERWKKSA